MSFTLDHCALLISTPSDRLPFTATGRCRTQRNHQKLLRSPASALPCAIDPSQIHWLFCQQTDRCAQFEPFLPRNGLASSIAAPVRKTKCAKAAADTASGSHYHGDGSRRPRCRTPFQPRDGDRRGVPGLLHGDIDKTGHRASPIRSRQSIELLSGNRSAGPRRARSTLTCCPITVCGQQIGRMLARRTNAPADHAD